MTISDLPYQTPVTVNFAVLRRKNVNGMEIVNTAQAYADNADKGLLKIWVNSPVLKSRRRRTNHFKYGDITYRIKLTQEQTGCVARNVTLQDVVTDTQGYVF